MYPVPVVWVEFDSAIWRIRLVFWSTVQGFLVALPVFRADHYEVGTISARHPEWYVLSDHLFRKAFQVVSEPVYADAFH